MGYADIDQAKIRIDEALKMGLESQRVHREMSEGKSGFRGSMMAFLRTKILATICFLQMHGRRVYCRTRMLMRIQPECVEL
jgi:hypothetical protein